MDERFTTGERDIDRWNIGVLATPAETFDETVVVRQQGGALRVAPLPRTDGAHFSGYVSTATFDLRSEHIAAELRRPAAGGVTIIGIAIDSANWLGFRIQGDSLFLESHTEGKIASKEIPYDPARHRYLRLRVSDVASVVVWESSADGTNWKPEYVETPAITISALRIALSAGTADSTASVGAATFGRVKVERKP